MTAEMAGEAGFPESGLVARGGLSRSRPIGVYPGNGGTGTLTAEMAGEAGFPESGLVARGGLSRSRPIGVYPGNEAPER